MTSREPFFVGLDLETTSADPTTARIVEVAVVSEASGTARRWLVNPGVPIPAEATEADRLLTMGDRPVIGDVPDARVDWTAAEWLDWQTAQDSARTDTRTVPLPLPYPDGSVERVERVVSAEVRS